LVQSIIDGTYDGSNYYGGVAEGLVGITSLASFCADGTQEKVDEAYKRIVSGEFNIFDGVLETNDGNTVGSEGSTLDDSVITGGIDWYYKNVVVVE
jgi:basic membrane protein A